MTTETIPAPASALVARAFDSWGLFGADVATCDGSSPTDPTAEELEALATRYADRNDVERAWVLRGLVDATDGNAPDPGVATYLGWYRRGYNVGVERIECGYSKEGEFSGLDIVAGRIVAGDYPGA